MFIILLQQTAAPPTPAITEVFRQLYENFVRALPGIMTGALVLLVFLIVAATGKRIIARLAPRANADTGVVLLLSRVFYYGVLILGILTALPATHLDVSALIAGLGLTGFAVGFALKDVLSNLLAGIMLLIYRPFNIGDHIKMGEHEGTITTIRMRDTVLRAADGRSVIIPNTKLITEVVINNSTAQLMRDTVRAHLADETDLGQARKLILETLGAESEVVKRVEPQVAVTQDGGTETVLEGAFWFDPRRTNRADAQQQVCASLRRALSAASIRANVLSQVAAPAVAPKTAPAETTLDGKEENIYE